MMLLIRKMTESFRLLRLRLNQFIRLSNLKRADITQNQINDLLNRIKALEDYKKESEAAFVVTADSIKKMSDLCAQLSIVQQHHLSQTDLLNQQMEIITANLFPKSELKYDLTKEPYN